MNTTKQYKHNQTIGTQPNNMNTTKQYEHNQTIWTQPNNMNTTKRYEHNQTIWTQPNNMNTTKQTPLQPFHISGPNYGLSITLNVQHYEYMKRSKQGFGVKVNT